MMDLVGKPEDRVSRDAAFLYILPTALGGSAVLDLQY